MKNTPFLLILLALLAMGCNKRLAATLVPDGSVSFTLDSTSSCFPRYISIYTTPQGEEELVMLSEYGSYLQFFNLKNRQRTKHIQLLGAEHSPCGHYVASEDSIFIVHHRDDAISLVDGQGKTYRRYPAGEYAIRKGSIYTNYSGWIYRAGDKLYFRNFPAGAIPGRTDIFQQAYAGSSLDIQTGEYTYFKPYPQQLHGHPWGFLYFHVFTYNPHQGQFVYGYQGINLLETFRLTDGHVIQYPISNGQFKNLPSVAPDYINQSDHYIQDREFPRYDELIYDPYRKVYYYIVEHAMKPSDRERFFEDITYRVSIDFSILILNEQFQKLSEVVMDNRRYGHHRYFVAKDGLYFSNLDNPKDGEISFTRLQLKRKKA